MSAIKFGICNSVCISKLASMSVNHIMKRCIAEFAQNTAEYMYPAFKINKDFEWGILETLTSKNGYTNLAKCELKKKWHNRISVTITMIMRFGFENLYKKKKCGW